MFAICPSSSWRWGRRVCWRFSWRRFGEYDSASVGDVWEVLLEILVGTTVLVLSCLLPVPSHVGDVGAMKCVGDARKYGCRCDVGDGVGSVVLFETGRGRSWRCVGDALGDDVGAMSLHAHIHTTMFPLQ